ncbi:thioredoxin family protein [Macrococcus equipercicus]|uniref:Thioredoxin family protein n=1 Tax=Macrococcus equipercicus TaxID=69967 RepID=A0ABQ6R6D6_9STAP|nr:thioredoxin family protein [Macrococcus equipercicus]KAA1036596.1 thioredoxin family protein [Macrococcus equipercicus]
MTKLKTYFENGLTADDYINQMEVNKEEMQTIYDNFELPEDARLESVTDKHLKAIAITEDWCGDAMMTIPVLLKIAEQAGIDVRFVLRDENLDLIDQYLTNGTARAIPIFVFMDNDYHQTAVWGPRAQKVQEFVTETRSDLPAKEDPTFDEKSKEKHQVIHDKYKNTPEFWQEVYQSIVDRLVHA